MEAHVDVSMRPQSASQLSRRIRASVCGFLLTAALPAAAWCPDMSPATPAQLIDTPKQRELIGSLLPPWETDEESRIFYFGAIVTEDGELSDICCGFSTFETSRVESRSLLRKLERLEFQPAELFGDPMPVFVGFSIVGAKGSDGFANSLLLNQLQSSDLFGTDYIAPQRLADESIWPPTRWRPGSVKIEVTASIDTRGRPSGVRVTDLEAGTDKLAQHFVEALEEACYVPGYVDNERIAMHYIESIEN